MNEQEQDFLKNLPAHLRTYFCEMIEFGDARIDRDTATGQQQFVMLDEQGREINRWVSVSDGIKCVAREAS